MRPYLDKVIPDAWKAAEAFSAAVAEAVQERGLTERESELIKVRASQLNGCAFCLDLHSRRAREAGIEQQLLDLLPVWRATALFTERERAVLAVAEAATRMPLSMADAAALADAKDVLGDEVFVAAEWVAVAINAFNRVSILSAHPVRARRSEPGASG